MQSLGRILEPESGVDLLGFEPSHAHGVSADGTALVGWARNPQGCSEAFVAVLDVGCADGLDDDGDGRSDFDPATRASPGDPENDPAGRGDPGCASPTLDREDSQARDGVRNATDGEMDYDGGRSRHGIAPTAPDPHCAGAPWEDEERPGYGLGHELGFPLAPLLRRRRRGVAWSGRGW